jgi:hypothetical protein
VELPLFLYPRYRSFWEFFIPSTLILQMANTRNSNNNAENNNVENIQDVSPPPPPCLLLSKCWLCKNKCFRPYNRQWSTCKILNPKWHHSCQGIGLEIFNIVSHQPSHTLWSQWMLMIDSSPFRRSCKWYSATIMRRCC